MFCGRVEFSGGVWAGVELSEGEGKNDGSVDGITYFRCPPLRGKRPLLLTWDRLSVLCSLSQATLAC